MTRYDFTISPDANPDSLPGWFIFNTWLQRHTGLGLHLELYDDYPALHQAVTDGKVDMIYANAFDAAELVRRRGFTALARPAQVQDEAVIVVRADDPATRVEDLQAGLTVAATDDPDVNMICRIMLEPADIGADDLDVHAAGNQVLVAKAVLRGEVRAGFMLQAAFDALSPLVSKSLRPLVRSLIRDIHHVLLVGPSLVERRDDLVTALVAMHHDPRGAEILHGMGFTQWEAVDDETMEFMIDLMHTLEG